MQKIFRTIVSVLIVAMSSVAVFAQAQSSTPLKGVVRIKVQAELAEQLGNEPQERRTAGVLSTGVKPLDRVMGRVKGMSIKRLIPYSAKHEAQRKKYGLDRWYEVTFDESVNPLEARVLLSQVAGVQVAENVVPMVNLEGKGGFIKADAVAAAPATATMPFNDPRLNQQWHYQNYGTIGGTVAGVDINLFKAWEIETGSKDVVVAIIDGGVDYTHEDLADAMWVNEAELNGTPGVDDDGNGYIDDVYGYNFSANEGGIYPHAHGTHVAGTVGAINNNRLGVGGVAGGKDGKGGVRLMSVQIFDSRVKNDGNFVGALTYAAENGASIAQCSWGWETEGYKEQSIMDAIDYFIDTANGGKMRGGIAIFAAGNNGQEGVFYPAAYDRVVSVAAMTPSMEPAPYSNHGEWVDVVAPGGYLEYDTRHGVLSTLPDNSYGYNEGTSMATPHVSGIAALVLSKYGKADLLNESLRNQLITSVNDFYTSNPSVVGKFGAGYIDAYKALQMGDGTAPAAVSDMELLPSQDNIVIEWTIPASVDNNVNHHVVYFSTTAFSADSDLSKLMTKVVDTKFLTSGAKMTYELAGLAPTTTYYVAMTAVDRWGNASALSEVKSSTTNAGPMMSLDATSLEFSHSPEAPGEAVLTLNNMGEGLLQWHHDVKVAKVGMSYFSTKTANPGNVRAYSGMVAGSRVVAHEVAKVEDGYIADDYPQNIKYWDSHWANIGDEDASLPNSMAQLFTVDAEKYPNGFNLTHVNIGGANGTNCTIEIYKGGSTIKPENRISTVTPAFFMYNTDMTLGEQTFFNPGESFWVVVHFPVSDTKYPLGLCLDEDDNAARNCYMSTDYGMTWSPMAEVLKGSSFETVANTCSWYITAVSKNPDWSTMLKLTPSQGIVRSGESQAVTVSTDGCKLVNNTYTFNLNIITNEFGGNTVTIPTTVQVSGNKCDVKAPSIVNFGDLLVGQSKTISVELVNMGYGAVESQWGGMLYSDAFSCTDANFSGPQNGFSLSARSTGMLEVTYTPTAAGIHTGEFSVMAGDGNVIKFTVRGIATDPSKITITPATIEVGDLTVGEDAVEAQFEIGNEGAYPLQYVMPRFSNAEIDGAGALGHRYGYEWESNVTGSTTVAYDGNPALVDATDITGQFSDTQSLSKELPLGFEFNYYGKTYDHVRVLKYGGVVFEQGEYTPRTPLYENNNTLVGYAMVSIYGHDIAMGANSRIECAKADGKFIVKYTNVMAVVYGNDYTPVSFHMALCSNGDIEVYYDDYDYNNIFQMGSNLFIGLVEPTQTDPLVIASANMNDNEYAWPTTELGQRYKNFVTGAAVRISAPAPYFIQSIDKTTGVVNPGEKVTVTATLAANAEMNAGAITNNLIVISNDPAQSTSYVRFNANIKGDMLTPALEVASDAVEFGDVFRTSVSKKAVTVTNSGKDSFIINSAVVEGGKFAVETTFPVEVKAGYSKDIIVVLPTEVEGAVSDKLTITTTCGTAEVALSGKVIGVPTATLSATDITLTVNSGEKAEGSLTIANNGNEALEYAFGYNPYVSIAGVAVENQGTKRIDYGYKASVDDSSVKYEWRDIETTGLGEQTPISYYLNSDFITVNLPFAFPFYGKEYTKMYVYNTGFVSFTERNDENIWPEPPAGTFPAGSLYNNVIAPYWGMHTMDQTNTSGTYHYVTDEEVVVSWMEYGNSVNFGVCFQLIMRKDGSFKFQYKMFNEYSQYLSIYGVVGVSNIDGTDGVSVPERCLSMNNAIEFFPLATSTLAAGESKKVDYTVYTDEMKGEYYSTLDLTTNVPGSENIAIPVNLTVEGTAIKNIPAELTSEFVAGDMNALTWDGYYSLPFTVANDGRAEYTIESIDLSAMSPMIMFMAKTRFFDTLTGDWLEFDAPYDGMPIVVGKDACTFTFNLMDCFSIADYEFPVVFTFDDGTTHTMNVKISATETPMMIFDRESINVSTTDDYYEGSETINMYNMGEYKLTYELRLDPSGVGEVIDDGSGDGGEPWIPDDPYGPMSLSPVLNDSTASLKPFSKDGELIYDVPSNIDEFDDAIFYPALTPSNPLMYGSGNTYTTFYAATVFTAPAGGFNISDVYTVVSLGNLTNAKYTAKVIKGSDPATGVVLTQGSVVVDEAHDLSEELIISLDKAVYLNEGETFTIMIEYPKGIPSCAYITSKIDGYVAGRYLAAVEGMDVFQDFAGMFKDQYGSIGWLITGLQREKSKPWISLDESVVLKGELAPGSMLPLKFNINAATAPLEKGNKAVLVVKSNDPSKHVVNYEIYLDKNGAPTVMSMMMGDVYVSEGSTTVAQYFVSDPEGESFQLVIDDVDNIARIDSVESMSFGMEEVSIVTGEDGVVNVGPNTMGVMVTVLIDAQYGTAGNHNFALTAIDATGHSASCETSYVVEHVNRAPIVAQPVNDFTLGDNQQSEVIDYEAMFTDPDGDELTYSMTMTNNKVVEVFTTKRGAIFLGVGKGETKVTVTATDGSGAKVSTTFKITVTGQSGVESAEIRNGVSIYPNPVETVANVACNFEAQEIAFVLSAMNGAQVMSKVVTSEEGNVHQLDMTALPAGVYTLEVKAAGKKATFIVVKK